MSALGHYLEEGGIATVAISLIRPQTENTKPPRALWVPFELGRPFGPPSDPAFQKVVIPAALRMFERETGPVVSRTSRITTPDPAWRPPFISAEAAAGPADAIAAPLEAEGELLRGPHQRWITRHRRTTVGLSGLPIGECTRYVADWLRGKAPPSPREGFSAPLLLRFAVDDVKACWLEAAAAGAAKPSSRQLGDWFWNESAAGAAIYALREALQTERRRTITGNFMVPAAWVRAG